VEQNQIPDLCREKIQLDATQWFIEVISCSTSFGHYYAHHQTLETTGDCSLWHITLCLKLVMWSGVGLKAMRPGWGTLLERHPSTQTHSFKQSVMCHML